MTSHIARKVVESFQKIANPSHDYQTLSIREQEVCKNWPKVTPIRKSPTCFG